MFSTLSSRLKISVDYTKTGLSILLTPYQLPTLFGPCSGQVHQLVDLTPVKYEQSRELTGLKPMSDIGFAETLH